MSDGCGLEKRHANGWTRLDHPEQSEPYHVPGLKSDSSCHLTVNDGGLDGSQSSATSDILNIRLASNSQTFINLITSKNQQAEIYRIIHDILILAFNLHVTFEFV